VADSCAATEPDPKEKEAAVQGETHPALGEEELLEIAAVSIVLPHSSPEPERFVDVP